ncbi:allatostatin-A receptor-like [Nematostella vectensis]|uniref:allatostatin-A receptor-like n=1 Tax=Nematostella vectensis TaxID=45351 RepID=UPI0020774EAF|nr:allatostatin-A receptor-like [Nematostella vectensis]
MLSTEEIVVKTAFTLGIVCGTFGNALVCLVVLSNKSMRSTMNYLVVNLALSDTILLLFFAPSFVFNDAFTHPAGQAGDLLCVFITGETFAWTAGYASATFLLAIAVERYYAVAKPHSYGARFLRKRVKLMVAVCWTVALAWNSPGFWTKHYDERYGYCAMTWNYEYSFRVYAMLSFLFVSLAPSASMIILYSKVVHALWFSKQSIRNHRTEERDRLQRKRATKMVLSVSVIYTFCWIPQSTVFMISAFSPELIQGNIAYPAAVAMVTINAGVNPLLYSFYSNQMRREIGKLLGCPWGERVGHVTRVMVEPNFYGSVEDRVGELSGKQTLEN